MRCDQCVDALNAYVDDELLADERADVEAHVATCGDCARERDALARLHSTLNEELVRYQAPDVLKARIRGAIAQAEPLPLRVPERSPRWWRLAAAGVLIAALSSSATVAVMRSAAQRTTTDEQVLAAHVRSLMPGHLMDVVSTNQHNVKPWFNGRVDLSPPVPDLAANDFTLAGGRIDYIAGQPAAVVVYTRRLHVVNVYSLAAAGETQPAAETRKGFHLVHWRHDGLEHWVVSDLNQTELDQFVAAYERY